MKKSSLLVSLLLLSCVVGCNRLKGDKGEVGAQGAQGPGGPGGAPGQFFEFSGIMPSNGIVPIGQLGNDSLVAVFLSNDTPPATHWFSSLNHDINFPAGTVTFFNFLPTWSYKIVVIHNPGSQSTSLL